MIANTNSGMKCQIDQIFAPVVGIQRVSNMEEALKTINQNQYGLEANIFTRDEKTIDFMSNHLRVGTVNFNDADPFEDMELPTSGRSRCSKVFKGSKHIFRKFSKFKSINLNM